MTINRITNTPIIAKHYASLALRQMRVQSHSNLVVQPDGTLWAAIPYSTSFIRIMRSTDNGFSWDIARETFTYTQRYSTTGSSKGPLIALQIDEYHNHVDVVSSEWEFIGSTWLINRERFDLDTIETDTSTNTDGIVDYSNSQGVFDYCFNARNGYLVYNDGSSNLSIKLLSNRSTSASSEVDLADSVIAGPGPTCICDENSIVYAAYTSAPGGNNLLRFSKMITDNGGLNTWSAGVTVQDLGDSDAYADDVVISLDGYGNLCLLWALRDTSAATTDVYYSISTDSGSTWGTPVNITRESGYEQYVEPVNTLPVSYCDMIGGHPGGFMLTYCDKETSDTNGHTFVRHLSTSDGVTYSLGDQKEIGTRYDGKDVVGAHFFRPTDSTKLLDFGDVGHIRVGYTVGEGEDQDGLYDVYPIIVAQELLSEVAFTSTLDTDTSTYTIETTDENGILINFNILGSPQDNVDYYTLGLTGNQTTKYINAFNRLGTNLRFLRYEPDQTNYMNDRSSYNGPTETSSRALFDPQSYAFPTPQITATGNDSWIERDVRKIFLPPTLHLARTFIINEGGYLKRTVWLAQFDGNEYEISQVVPRFIDNQICYYEANCYVVGPSRDPFSRTILPSET